MALIVEYDPYELYITALKNLISEVLFLSKYDPIDNVHVAAGPLDVEFVRELIPTVGGIVGTPLAVISLSNDDEHQSPLGGFNHLTRINQDTKTAKIETAPDILTLRYQLTMWSKYLGDMNKMKTQIVTNFSKIRPAYVSVFNNRSIVKIEGGFTDETNSEPGQEDMIYRGSFNLVIDRAYFPKPIQEYPLIERFNFGPDYPSISHYKAKSDGVVISDFDTGDAASFEVEIDKEDDLTRFGWEIETGMGTYLDFSEDMEIYDGSLLTIPTDFIFSDIYNLSGIDKITIEDAHLKINFNDTKTNYSNGVKLLREEYDDFLVKSKMNFSQNFEVGGLTIENDKCFAFIGYGGLDYITFYYYDRTIQEVFKSSINIEDSKDRSIEFRLLREDSFLSAYYIYNRENMKQVGNTVGMINMDSTMKVGIFGYNPKETKNYSLSVDNFIISKLST